MANQLPNRTGKEHAACDDDHPVLVHRHLEGILDGPCGQHRDLNIDELLGEVTAGVARGWLQWVVKTRSNWLASGPSIASWIFVVARTQQEHARLLPLESTEMPSQCGRPLHVVCAVDQQIRAKHLQSAGMSGRAEARQDVRPVGYRKTIRDAGKHGERDTRVQHLVVPHEAHTEPRLIAPIKGPAEDTVSAQVHTPGSRGQEWRALVVGDRTNDLNASGSMAPVTTGRPGLMIPASRRRCRRDLTELIHVVHAHTRDGGHDGIDHVRCVETPAHSDFHDDDIQILPREVHKGSSRHQLEVRQDTIDRYKAIQPSRPLLPCLIEPLEQGIKLSIADGLAVNVNPLIDVLQMRVVQSPTR